MKKLTPLLRLLPPFPPASNGKQLLWPYSSACLARRTSTLKQILLLAAPYVYTLPPDSFALLFFFRRHLNSWIRSSSIWLLFPIPRWKYIDVQYERTCTIYTLMGVNVWMFEPCRKARGKEVLKRNFQINHTSRSRLQKGREREEILSRIFCSVIFFLEQGFLVHAPAKTRQRIMDICLLAGLLGQWCPPLAVNLFLSLLPLPKFSLLSWQPRLVTNWSQGISWEISWSFSGTRAWRVPGKSLPPYSSLITLLGMRGNSRETHLHYLFHHHHLVPRWMRFPDEKIPKQSMLQQLKEFLVEWASTFSAL